MDKSRAFFSIKRGERRGDRLTLRFPGKNLKIAEKLRSKGITHIPSQITIGYYRQPDDPEGAWKFIPIETVSAATLLTVVMVQRRIAKDLLNYM